MTDKLLLLHGAALLPEDVFAHQLHVVLNLVHHHDLLDAAAVIIAIVIVRDRVGLIVTIGGGHCGQGLAGGGGG